MMNISEIVSIEKTNLKKYDYCVSWKVNSLCNFNCYFCLQKGSNDSHFSKDDINNNKEELSVVLNKINQEFRQIHKKRILINLIGGEPTLSDLPCLIESLQPNDNKIKIAIITNFSCDDKYLDKLRQAVNKGKKIQINASLHETETDVNKFIEKAKRNMDLLKTINIVIHNENSLNIYKRLVKEFEGQLKIVPQIVNINDCLALDEELVEEIRFSRKKNFLINGCVEFDKYELINQIADKDNSNKYPSFKGYKCIPFTRIKNGKYYRCYKNDKITCDDILIDNVVTCNAEICRLCNFVKIER